MKPMTMLWTAVSVIVGAVVLFTLFKPQGGGISNVDAGGARAAIDGGAQVIDVRTPGEYQMGHIPGAINVPVDEVASAAAAWDPNATYVIYCASGVRSATAVATLKGMGFGNIKHLAAGIVAWDGDLERGSTSGRKIETAGKPVFIDFWSPD